jgi:threonine dehydratase
MPTVESPYDAETIGRDVVAAADRIRPYIRETPVEFSPALSAETGARVFLKLETGQVTGSFKARGAFSKLLALSPAERQVGVVTASTGNHALAMALAMPAVGVTGEIFLPESASPVKIDALRAQGARLRLIDIDPGAVEVVARTAAVDSGRCYVSPYNDREIIAGQGTIALELTRQLERIDAVFVPVGGGGLIAGIAGYLKAHAPATTIVGCQPAASSIMTKSVAAGTLLELPSEDSISDATVGLVEPGAITFPICRDCVDDWVLVDEGALRSAVWLMLSRHSILVEGAGALAVAALRARGADYRGRSVVLVASGSHIAPRVLAEIMTAHLGTVEPGRAMHAPREGPAPAS